MPRAAAKGNTVAGQDERAEAAADEAAYDEAAYDEAAYDEEEQRVTTLELFFDLVFVFTLTQLTALLTNDLTGEGMARVVLIFAVLWWMYAAYAWLTNQVPPVRANRQITLVGGMAAFLVCALAIPRTFDDGGVAFGIGYLFVVLVHGVLYAQALPIGTLLRFVPFNVVSALLIIGAGLVDASGPKYGLWVTAVLLEFCTPYIFRPTEQVNVHTAHFVERHGLLLIVAFGESIVAIGIGTNTLPFNASFFGAALLGLALVAMLWWAYFGDDDAGAERALAAEPWARRGRLAIRAYYQAFALMLLGVIVLAAGVKKALGHIDDELDAPTALALGGGGALYLLGDVVFRTALRILPIPPRAIAAVLAVATIPIGVYVNGALQFAALIAVVGLALLAEFRWRR